jgi:hypothetical protein
LFSQTKTHPLVHITSLTVTYQQKLLNRGNKIQILSLRNQVLEWLRLDSNKWKEYHNKISKMMILLSKFNKDIDNNKKRKILNLRQISSLNSPDLMKKFIRNKYQDLEPIMMVRKINGIKELIIYFLLIFDQF